jgi:hypothetical protein
LKDLNFSERQLLVQEMSTTNLEFWIYQFVLQFFLWFKGLQIGFFWWNKQLHWLFFYYFYHFFRIWLVPTLEMITKSTFPERLPSKLLAVTTPWTNSKMLELLVRKRTQEAELKPKLTLLPLGFVTWYLINMIKKSIPPYLGRIKLMYTGLAEPRGARASIFGPLKRSKTFFLTWMNFFGNYPLRFFNFCCACVMLWISLLWNKLFSHSQKRFSGYLFWECWSS